MALSKPVLINGKLGKYPSVHPRTCAFTISISLTLIFGQIRLQLTAIHYSM